MATFHQVRVKNLYKETKDCTVLTFDIPNDLAVAFHFRQGQHLTLRAFIDGEDVRRSYSLCTSPFENTWSVAVKQIPGGKFSTYVNQTLKVGSTLEVMPPSGTFGVSCGQAPKNYVAFAAGSGITPILSMIKTHLEQEPQSTFQLFYLNRTVKSIIFKETLEQLRNQYFGRLEIYYFLTQERRDIELFNGRFTEDKLQEIFDKLVEVPAVDEVFLCGPEEMIFLVRDELLKRDVPQERIHYELFVSGLSEADKERAERLAQQKVVGVEVTLIDGGKEFHFTMTDDYDNLLDAALGAGADLPFACKGGVCSTCKCKILEGNVEMKVNYALEENELNQHFVLSCQSVPVTPKVTLDFDV
ncbi:MAG TPA: 2Fe-2S iron-sulfur cluster-binding protein [Flavobacteriaceae bacterium]|nr:2Fe-2S iron-sulfur cluster binding domain-containing protein [Flavobacteriaceae bacterium]HPF12019.1 2Fe-2S iron-sulfur cluster-binding protein [Flavobacteriaceae bacterium]HQU21402.1 2Fe-2S iron-sulfur cluster-binding protein [Flavobacteriaceae bacterium]HQU65146.1 2Fe-2S iron-sulfur cluster-binding protein [Flavobacteriaceae bacterium]HRW45297.1 2Fe-2S iron-sulfur cluster-binding protein [Flavobacteriaceae bacterium]